MIVSEDSAIAASKQAYAEMLKPYAQKGKIDNNPALKDRVYRITDYRTDEDEVDVLPPRGVSGAAAQRAVDHDVGE